MKREIIERQLEQEAEHRDWCRTAVSTWTENTINDGYEPTLDGFLQEYPEYDCDELIDTIEAEMERVKALCMKEKEAKAG